MACVAFPLAQEAAPKQHINSQFDPNPCPGQCSQNCSCLFLSDANSCLDWQWHTLSSSLKCMIWNHVLGQCPAISFRSQGRLPCFRRHFVGYGLVADGMAIFQGEAKFAGNPWSSAERAIFIKFQAPKFGISELEKMQFHSPPAIPYPHQTPSNYSAFSKVFRVGHPPQTCWSMIVFQGVRCRWALGILEVTRIAALLLFASLGFVLPSSQPSVMLWGMPFVAYHARHKSVSQVLFRRGMI